MLHQFLDTHRADLIDRCRLKVAGRPAPNATAAATEHGIPRFLGQLIRTLRLKQATWDLKCRAAGAGAAVPAGADTATPDTSEIGVTAMLHGLELSKQGVTIDHVIHEYGDLCQAITELACETRTTIDAGEFKTLNRCLDDAIAGAVIEFSYQHDPALTDRNIRPSGERARALLHELQRHVEAVTLAIGAVKTGDVGFNGATGVILKLSLLSMNTLIARSLADTKTSPGSAA